MPSTRTATLNLLLLVISLGVTLGILEIAVRTVRPPAVSPHSYRIPDRVLGWRLEPGVEVVLRKPDYTRILRVNRDGWRDLHRDLEKPDGTLRIVVLGDSFMEAYSVDLADSFAQQLEGHISENRAVEVINLGVGGYGTLQEYLVFKGMGSHYDPDLVLLGFSGNDTRNNSLALEQAFYRDEPENYKVLGRPFLDPGRGDWVVRFPNIDRAVALAQQHRDKLAALPWWKNTALWDLLRQARHRANDIISAEGVGGEDTRDLQSWLGAYFCEDTDEYAEAWEITGRILVRLRHDVEAIGANLVVFTVPSILDLDDEALEDATGRLSDDHCFESSRQTNRVMEILRELEIPGVDLAPSFRAARSSGLFHTKVDRHWNEAGHKLAARVVHDHLTAEGLLRP